MNEPNLPGASELTKEAHPLIKLGIVAAGSKIGAELILRLARHPALLLAMGVATGFYANKNRKEIIAAASEIKEYGLKVVKKQAD